MLKSHVSIVLCLVLLGWSWSLQAGVYNVYQGVEGETFELKKLNNHTSGISSFNLKFAYQGDPKLIEIEGVNVHLVGDDNFHNSLYAVEDNRVTVNGVGQKKIKGITVHYSVAELAIEKSPTALKVSSHFEVDGAALDDAESVDLAIFKPITLSAESGRIYEGSSRSYRLSGLVGLSADKPVDIDFLIDKDADLYVSAVRDVDGKVKVSTTSNKASLNKDETVWPNELEVTLTSRDNSDENGIRKYVVEHKLVAKGVRSVGDADYPDIDGRYTVFVHDDDHSKVCLSKTKISGSCFDLHLGVMSIYSESGSLKTKPLVRLISRSKIARKVEGEFEALYYTIPELADEEDTTDNPFKSSGATYKLTGLLKRRLGNSFSAVFSMGARVAPSQYHRLRDVSPFVGLGVEYEAEFSAGRGIVGLARVKDRFWHYNEVDETVVPEVMTERDFSQRIRLYASLALNDSGSIMLSTHMDMGYGKRIDEMGNRVRSPSEVGIALTYGGKWEEIFSKLGE